MKYLVVMPEVAYITRNDGKGPIDAWDTPNGRWFKPAKAVEIPEEMDASEAFKRVELTKNILDCNQRLQ